MEENLSELEGDAARSRKRNTTKRSEKGTRKRGSRSRGGGQVACRRVVPLLLRRLKERRALTLPTSLTVNTQGSSFAILLAYKGTSARTQRKRERES